MPLQKKGYEISIPEGNLRYAILQGQAESVYRKSWFLRKFLFYRLPQFFSYEKVVSLEARLFPNRVRKEINLSVQKHFEKIRPYLPKTASRTLDIASGQGFIDVLLFKHFRNEDMEVHLLDKFELASKVTYGMQDDAPAYASAQDAEELMQANGIRNVYIHKAGKNSQTGCSGPFDLIISTGGWGYMFPVNGYLEQVYDLLRPGGIVITNLRKGAREKEQEALLKSKFGNLSVLFDYGRGKCILLRK